MTQLSEITLKNRYTTSPLQSPYTRYNALQSVFYSPLIQSGTRLVLFDSRAFYATNAMRHSLGHGITRYKAILGHNTRLVMPCYTQGDKMHYIPVKFNRDTMSHEKHTVSIATQALTTHCVR